MGSILHRTDGTEPFLPWDGGRYFDHARREVLPKFTLTPRLWEYLQAYAAKHRAAGNGFGFGLVRPDSVTRTLSARYYKDGSEILVWQGDDRRPRRLTPRECARLMGFPDTFRIPVSDTQELYLHLRRQGTGSVEILAWQLVPAWDAEQVEDPTLPVWDGGDSASYSSHPPKGAAAL